MSEFWMNYHVKSPDRLLMHQQKVFILRCIYTVVFSVRFI